jgi:monovalent cation:H+ antiporter-2, CPA2 family
MLIDGQLLLQYIGPVIIITLLVIIGKTFFVSAGALLSGTPLKQSVQAGTSMSQIGEFSFIIATVGISLKVTADYLYPIAVGVSVLTVFTTPYMMRFSEPLYVFLEKKLPRKWLNNINNYSSVSGNLKAETDWQRVIKAFLQLIFVNVIIIIGLILLTIQFIKPFLEENISNNLTARIVTAIIAFLLMMPFVWGLTGRRIHSSAYRALWLDEKYNRGPLVLLEIVRNAIAVILIGVFLLEMFNWYWALAGTALMMIIVLVLFRRKLQGFYQRLEKRFVQNLTEKELTNRHDHLSPWDAHLATYDVDASLPYIGKTLEELGWREKYGVNIAYIHRGNEVIIAPKKGDQIFPFDNLGVIGTDQQLHTFGLILVTNKESHILANDKEHVSLQTILVDENTKLKGKTIRESGLAEHALVVGIERQGRRILNPSSTTVFEWDDLIWIVGDRRKIRKMFS